MPTAELKLGRHRRARRGEETRDLVLDAAEECFARFGVAQTTIDDVVRVAKVPRATLYRHAGGKDELVAAVALREIDRFFAKLARHVSRFDNVADVIVEGTLFAVEHYRSSDLLARALAPEMRGHGPKLITDAVAQARDRMVAYVTPMVEAGRRTRTLRPELTPEDVAEWMMRTIGSLVMMPSPWPDNRRNLRGFLHRTLVPVFVPDAAR